jgi:hypothetical protein
VSEIIEIGLCVVDLTARARVSRHRLLGERQCAGSGIPSPFSSAHFDAKRILPRTVGSRAPSAWPRRCATPAFHWKPAPPWRVDTAALVDTVRTGAAHSLTVSG